jgi:hypothetical protein
MKQWASPKRKSALPPVRANDGNHLSPSCHRSQQTMTQTGHDRKLNLKPPAFGHELAVINAERAFLNVIC